MLDILIIFVRKLNFVKLRRNRFLKNILESTLRVTVTIVGEMHEIILSITRGSRRGSRTPAACKRNLLVSIVHNFEPLTIVTKNSVLDAAAPKLYFILIFFCFKWFPQNIMFMYFKCIQKILLNWYEIRKSTELH